MYMNEHKDTALWYGLTYLIKSFFKKEKIDPILVCTVLFSWMTFEERKRSSDKNTVFTNEQLQVGPWLLWSQSSRDDWS